MRTFLFVNSEWSKEKTSPHLHSRQLQTATLRSSETWFIWGIANANAASKLLLCHALRLQKQPSSKHRASLFYQKPSSGSPSCAGIWSPCWAEGCRPSVPISPQFCGWVRQGGGKRSMEMPCLTLAHCSVLEGAMHLVFFVVVGLLRDWTLGYFLGFAISVHFYNKKLCFAGSPWHDKNSYKASVLPLWAQVYQHRLRMQEDRDTEVCTSPTTAPAGLQEKSDTKNHTCGCYKLYANTNINVCGKGLWAFPSSAINVGCPTAINSSRKNRGNIPLSRWNNILFFRMVP